MKTRTDKILLAVFLLSAALWVLSILLFWEIIPVELPFLLNVICIYFALGGLAVPAFCLQLLLCRRVWRWIAVLYTLIAVGTALYFGYKTAVTTGWDGIGWLLLMILAIASVLGCVAAWVVYGLQYLHRRGDIRG